MRVSMIDPSLFTLPYDNALAAGLAGAGHDVTLYGRRVGPDDSDPAGVNLVPAFYGLTGRPLLAGLPGGVRLGVKGLDHIWSMARLVRRLRRERPDVIHFQWLPLPIVDRRMLGRFRRVAPLVLTVHDTNPFNGDPSAGLQARGASACFALFDRLIVHTRQGLARMRAFGVPERKLVVVPHGPSDLPPVAPNADAMLGTMTFMLFGKIKPYKGTDLLIEAFARLPEELREQARVRVVGKPYMDLGPLRALIGQRGVGERVGIEPRFVADAEIPALFAPGTVAVFPYREIEASGVLPQAMALGRPAIASALGSFAETLTDGVHGHLVPPDDADALTAAMAHLIADRGFAAACSRHARERSDRTESWEQIARRHVVTYEAAASG